MIENKYCVISYDKDAKILTKLVLSPDIKTDDLKSRIVVEKTLTDNDRNKSYKIRGSLECPFSGQMYITSEHEMGTRFNVFKTESYIDYLDLQKSITSHNLAWIHNIIDGLTEQEKIIHNENDFLLIPDYTWNDHTETSNLHVLAIVKDKSIMSLRDIRTCHLDLLKKIRTCGLEVIETVYGLEQNKVKMFFHYPPSTYLLHIHFMHINFYDGSSVERSHDLDSVIKNISGNENYYCDDMRIVSHT